MHRVLYDGGCGTCRRSRASLERLDGAGRLSFVDIHDRDQAKRLFPHLRWDDLMDEMHVIDARDRVTRGFYAFRTISGVLPALWVTWPLFWLPGVPLVGRRVYRWVARRRGRSCAGGACALHGGSHG